MVFTSAKPIWAIQRYASHYINHIHKKKKKKEEEGGTKPTGIIQRLGKWEEIRFDSRKEDRFNSLHQEPFTSIKESPLKGHYLQDTHYEKLMNINQHCCISLEDFPDTCFTKLIKM